MDKYKIVITQRAFSDLSECVLFVNVVSKEAAKKLHLEIIESIRSLETLPEVHSYIDGLVIGNSKVRRMIIHNGRYFIIYKVEKDIVTIYDILDSRKDNSILKL